jgi:uroporphyrin-III C-methyltransferase/precorrin-2 dehydrogenase/sirohydrochlorin ferrochelatase
MRYFPLFLDLKDRRAVIVGGGEEALRKVRLLLKTEARIDVVAPVLHDELAAELAAGRISWLGKVFSPGLLDDAAIVYSADPALHEAVSQAAQARGIPVNAVDDAALSTFVTPSIVDRDPVVVAIGTEGAAPMLGQGIRARIDAMLPQALGKLAETASSLRARVAQTVPQGRQRRSFWQRYFFGSLG